VFTLRVLEEEEEEGGNETLVSTRYALLISDSVPENNRRRGAISIKLLITRVDRSKEWRRSANSAHRETMSACFELSVVPEQLPK